MFENLGVKQVPFEIRGAYYFKGSLSVVGRNDTELGGSSPGKGLPTTFTSFL